MVYVGGYWYVTKEEEAKDWKAELKSQHSTVRLLDMYSEIISSHPF